MERVGFLAKVRGDGRNAGLATKCPTASILIGLRGFLDAERRPERWVYDVADRIPAALGPDFQNLEIVVDVKDEVFGVGGLDAQYPVIQQEVRHLLLVSDLRPG